MDSPGAQPSPSDGKKPRACSECARLKMKCRWPEGSSSARCKCARCTRMKLNCVVPENTPRRRRGKSTRVAQLEQRIDGIMSFLTNQNASATSPLTPESQHVNSVPAVETGRSVDASAGFSLLPGIHLTTDEANDFLATYKRDLMPNFPFVIITPQTNAHELFQQSPALFWAVMATAMPQAYSTQKQIKLWFRQYIAEHVLVRQEKTLQHLQAILVHLAWGDFHFYINAEATNLLQLALALVMDLRLDKSPDLGSMTMRSHLGEAWTALNHGVPVRLGVAHTQDDNRAVLGFYHLATLITLLFKRGAVFAWNAYLSQCCDVLLTEGIQTDQTLVALVTIQRIASKTHGMLPSPGALAKETYPLYRAPLDMAISRVREELEGYVLTLPSTVKNSKMFSAVYSVTVMWLYEPALLMKSPPMSTSDSITSEPFLRVESLWKCLQAAADTFSTLLTIPHPQLPNLSVTGTSVLAFAIVTSCRLLMLEGHDGWKPELARTKLDYTAALDGLAEQFEKADRWALENNRKRRLKDDSDASMCHYTSRLRWISRWYVAKVGRRPDVRDEPPQLDSFVWDGQMDFDFFSSDFMPAWAMPTD